MLVNVLFGAFFSGVVAVMAYHRKSLTQSGALSALIFGTVIYVFGGWLVWLMLIFFFIASSALTKIHYRKQPEDAEEKNGRNYVQVISNAFAASLFSVIYYVSGDTIYMLAAVVSIAASNADTWASEIGRLSKGKNYSILTFKEMPKGSSGAITLLGTFASILGALFISVIFIIFESIQNGFELVTLLKHGYIISVGGFIGCLLDSVMGILFQAKYKDASGKWYEHKKFSGESLILISGFTIITNDMVNLLSSLSASIMTIFLFAL
jgi:uncharacterized protein (TIGR00297 family)